MNDQRTTRYFETENKPRNIFKALGNKLIFIKNTRCPFGNCGSNYLWVVYSSWILWTTLSKKESTSGRDLITSQYTIQTIAIGFV